MTVLVTGAAGFIGAAVCEQLLDRGEQVVGVDNLNAYYDPALKRARLQRLEAQATDTRALEAWVGFRPSTPLAVRVQRFARWYLDVASALLI